MKNISIILTVLILLNPALYGAFSKSDAGTTTAAFLKLGAGARAAGLGDAFVSAADDSTAIYWNPAGLAQLKGKSFAFMHAIWFEDISYDWVSYAEKTRSGTFGAAIQYLSYGSIKKTDSTGAEVSDFSPNDLAANISYGNSFWGAQWGLTFKYISSKIEESATAFAIDVGNRINFLENNLSAGLCVQNIGTNMKFQETEEPLPLNIKAGLSYRIMEEWLCSFDINAPVDNELNYCLGGEYSKEIKDDVFVSGRAGYNTKTKDISGFTNFTFGLGVDYLGYIFDYAFIPMGDLGITHKISFSLKFDGFAENHSNQISGGKYTTNSSEKPLLIIENFKSENVTPQLLNYVLFMLKTEISDENFFNIVDNKISSIPGYAANADYSLGGLVLYNRGSYIISVNLTDNRTKEILINISQETDSVDNIRAACKKLAKQIKI